MRGWARGGRGNLPRPLLEILEVPRMAVLPPLPPHYTTEFRSDGLVNWPELELKYVNYQGVGVIAPTSSP